MSNNFSVFQFLVYGFCLIDIIDLVRISYDSVLLRFIRSLTGFLYVSNKHLVVIKVSHLVYVKWNWLETV